MRAAGVLAKGRMFDMPAVDHIKASSNIIPVVPCHGGVLRSGDIAPHS